MEIKKQNSRMRLLMAIALICMGTLLQSGLVHAQSMAKTKAPMTVGFSFPLARINDSSMAKIKSVGIDCIEISGISALVDKQTHLRYSDEDLRQMALKAKRAADKAGVRIWSIHMGFGKNIDISERQEARRAKTIAFHKKVLAMCQILQPKIILFHPSWYLGLNEREQRTVQLIRSCKELLPLISQLGATMVVENMLGFERQKDEQYERPLCRTVEETIAIFSRLPKSIGSAIDMNHIKNPEKLILAMGSRLKTIHVADGNGHEENHYLPCTGKGQNDWNAILDALYKVHYHGPFMFECHYKDVSELPACYRTLYSNYLTTLNR